MAEAAQAQQAAKGQVLNDRTYQEVEYLKKNLGPILVAALAEICIRRPADPIEYLGHWLLRWRYNEELKRRDVQNALEVVRQKATTKDDDAQGLQNFNQGFTPGTPFGAPGYGGPLEAGADAGTGEARTSATPAAPEDAGAGAQEKRASAEEKRLSDQQGEGGEAAPAEEARRASGEEARRASGGSEKRPSGGGQEPAAEGGEPTSEERRNSNEQAEQKRASGEAPAPEAASEPPTIEEPTNE